MGLFQRIAAAREAFLHPQANAITTSQGLAEEIWRSGHMAASGETVNVNTATRLTTVGRCVRLLSQTVATMPLDLFLEEDGGRRVKDVENPTYRMLHDRPNEWQTSHQWRSLKQRDLELRGNAYSLIVRGFGGRPQELLRLHPDRMEPRQADDLSITYEYTRPDGRRVDYRRDEILHVWFESDDGVKGISPIAMHREMLGDALALQRHGAKFFSNGAKPLGVLSYKGKMGPEAKADFRKDWESTYAGGENAYRTLLLPEGLDYKPVSISMEEAQYIEQRKFNISEIARIFGVPAHKAGDLERATFSNIEHMAIEFVQDAIVPRITGWEQAIHRDVLANDPDRYVKFNEKVLLRGDAKSQAEALQIERRNGIINANEWRELRDLNRREDAGGDEFIVEGNMRIQDGRDGAAQERAGT